MACLRRLTAALLTRNTKLATYTWFGSPVNFSTEVTETDLEPEHTNVNRAIFAGIVMSSRTQGRQPHVTLQHYGNVKLKVYASKNSPELNKVLREVQDGMNLAIEGSLAQRRMVKLVGEHYMIVDETYVNAEQIEIVKTQEDVERNYEKRTARILTHDK